jgi:hypothetical protein
MLDAQLHHRRKEVPMTSAELTEAEFRAFADELEAFSRQLTAKERSFLTSILVRATVAMALELPGDADSPDTAMQANLAYALWQSMAAPDSGVTRNPLPDRLARDERR